MPRPMGVHLACTAICCCLMLASAASPAPQQNPLGRLRPLDMSADPETVAYLLPRLADKYRPSREWSGVTDPRFYLLTEYDDPATDTNGIADEEGQNQLLQWSSHQHPHHRNVRSKRYNAMEVQRKTRFNYEEPSLSINAPIQSLRKVYAKERLRQRLEANRRFLENLGSNFVESPPRNAKRDGGAAGGNAAAAAGAGPATDLSGGSLSIVNSLDVLRNRLLLEIARKKAKEGAHRNRNMLMSLGKRWPMQSARDRVMARLRATFK
nr:unnamed protein product [Callosobruchus analis]